MRIAGIKISRHLQSETRAAEAAKNLSGLGDLQVNVTRSAGRVCVAGSDRHNYD